MQLGDAVAISDSADRRTGKSDDRGSNESEQWSASTVLVFLSRPKTQQILIRTGAVQLEFGLLKFIQCKSLLPSETFWYLRDTT